MTKLNRPVRREIQSPEINQWFPRGLIVEIAPPGILKIRPKRARARYLQAELKILRLYRDHVGLFQIR